MAYDVFLAYAPDDMDMASLVARRLRALKFKVRFNKRGEDPTFDDKDARDVLKSRSMLVLWSENGVKSDWVRAAASIGRSRKDKSGKDDILVQTALDESIPNEPFRLDKRFDLAGFTSRTNVEGWYQTVEELGRRGGRKNLRTWMDIPGNDEDAKTDWLDKHPDDPLALHARVLRDKNRGLKPTSAKAAADTVAMAASAISVGKSGPSSKTHAPLAASAPALTDNASGFGWMVPLLISGIGLLFLFGWLNGSKPLPRSGFIAPQLVATCPAGSVPRDLIASETLQTGPISNNIDP